MIEKQKVFKLNEKEIIAYKMTNKSGMSVEVINLGGAITKIITPDEKGNFENVVLAFKDYEDYYNNTSYLGALVGRTAGRISKGQVTIDGHKYSFFKNDNKNTLHGGKEGFSFKIWDVKTSEEEDDCSKIILSYYSKDGEGNYPGNLNCKVVYTLNNNNELILEYTCQSDRNTLVNLTNHSYFNLSGNKRDILNHELTINAHSFCELDEELIPTGKVLMVENTPFDFRKAKKVGKDINNAYQQLSIGGGYDHPWILDDGLKALTFYDPESKRAMDIETNQKAVVFYSMNMPDGKNLSNGNKAEYRHAACFETQNLPIGIDEAFKKQSILEKEKKYYHKTKFKFYVK